MTSTFESDCPYCNSPIIVYYHRWNGHCMCPNCKNIIIVDFAFWYGDDQEEYDIVSLEQGDFEKLSVWKEQMFDCETNNPK